MLSFPNNLPLFFLREGNIRQIQRVPFGHIDYGSSPILPLTGGLSANVGLIAQMDMTVEQIFWFILIH